MTCGLNLKGETISNKHNFVNYHIMCKHITAFILYVAKEDTKTYLAEVLVKLLAYSRNLALLGGLFVGLQDYRFFVLFSMYELIPVCMN